MSGGGTKNEVARLKEKLKILHVCQVELIAEE